MSGTKQSFTMGANAEIPVSPEEDADICASARPPFVGPLPELPERKDPPKLNSCSNRPHSYSR